MSSASAVTQTHIGAAPAKACCPAPVQLGNQFGAVAARHLDVAEHDVERFACKDLGRLRPVFSADRGLHA
ncbi:hypothetical protein [Cupriavidus necator]